MTAEQTVTVARLSSTYRTTPPVADGHAIRLDYRASTNAGGLVWVSVTIAPNGMPAASFR